LSQRKFKITINDKTFIVNVEEIKEQRLASEQLMTTRIETPSRAPPIPRRESEKTKEHIIESGIIRAPIPGVILSINVELEQEIEPGESLLVLEAMKMENEIHSPVQGRVREIRVSKGDRVDRNAILVVID
jgi:biotin carboxyl carrier protein